MKMILKDDPDVSRDILRHNLAFAYGVLRGGG
jgi:hypothetical protein